MTDKRFLGVIVFLSIAVFFTLFFLVMYGMRPAFASAPSGLPAFEALATTTSVGPQFNTQLFARNASCSARVVSTQGSGVMLIFADPTNGDLASTTLSGSKGFWQAASTTAAYDSGLYGCGRMFGFAYASTTITIMETR